MGLAYDRVKMSVSGTPGTGPITVGSASTGYRSFATAGAYNNALISLLIEDGTDAEYGEWIYSTTGPTLTRSKRYWSTTGSNLSVTSTAVISGTIMSSDIILKPDFIVSEILLAKSFAGGKRGIMSFTDGFNDGTGSTAINGVRDNTAKTWSPTTTTTQVNINTGTTPSSNLNGYTVFDMTTAIPVSRSVRSLGVNSSTAGSVTAKIGQRTSAGNFNVLAQVTFAHGGTGLEFGNLATPYVISTTNTYVGCYSALNLNYTSGISRAYISGNAVIGATPGFTEDTNVCVSMSYMYDTGYNNLTLFNNGQTLDYSASLAEASIILDAASNPTWGTSDTMELSLDAGTNYVAAIPIFMGLCQGGKLWRTPETACTAGTGMVARYKTLTNAARTVSGMRLSAR